MTTAYRMKLAPLTLETADPKSKAVLEKAKAQVGMVPNMYACMARVPGLLDTYLHGYGLFRKESGFSPAEQEVVFLAISRENECSYCMAAHSVIADTQSKVPSEVTEAIRTDAPVPDPKLRALARFTQTMVSTRGRPDEADVAALLAAGYTEQHILDIILAIGVKTLSNYTNHVFHTPVDSVFAGRRWKPAR